MSGIKSDDLKLARERSVDNLQRLYTVVVSLAIIESIKKLATAIEHNGLLTPYTNQFIFVSFIAIVIPFYHGANRYLDATYVTGERRLRSHGLLVDFIALFIEGLLLFTLAMVSDRQNLFYSFLMVLFIFDTIWIGFTKIVEDHVNTHTSQHIKWAIINISVAGVLFFIVGQTCSISLQYLCGISPCQQLF